jgi:hypothetical protein
MNTTLNYTGLSLTITRNIDPDIVVQALRSLEYTKPGPKSRWTLADLQDMREMLEGNSYGEVAEHYGLKRGDNVYQILKRAGMLPESKRRGRRLTVRIDFNAYRQKKCQTCDKNAGRRKAKLTLGQRFCLATDAEISECVRKG